MQMRWVSLRTALTLFAFELSSPCKDVVWEACPRLQAMQEVQAMKNRWAGLACREHMETDGVTQLCHRKGGLERRVGVGLPEGSNTPRNSALYQPVFGVDSGFLLFVWDFVLSLWSLPLFSPSSCANHVRLKLGTAIHA
eukprot:1159479-Pelagomonas_calceolata.AAC.2